MTLPPLTLRQRDALKAFRELWAENGGDFAPTMAELAARMGVGKVTVFGHVEVLVSKGYLVRIPNVSRGLSPRPQAEEAAGSELTSLRMEVAELRAALTACRAEVARLSVLHRQLAS